jgi:hypothetical protein
MFKRITQRNERSSRHNIKKEQVCQDGTNSRKVIWPELCPNTSILLRTFGSITGGSQRRFCPSRVTHSSSMNIAYIG